MPDQDNPQPTADDVLLAGTMKVLAWKLESVESWVGEVRQWAPRSSDVQRWLSHVDEDVARLLGECTNQRIRLRDR